MPEFQPHELRFLKKPLSGSWKGGGPYLPPKTPFIMIVLVRRCLKWGDLFRSPHVFNDYKRDCRTLPIIPGRAITGLPERCRLSCLPAIAAGTRFVRA